MGFLLQCTFNKILIAGLEIMRGTWFHDLSWQPVQFPEEEYINGNFVAVYES
jgi:hypothetical protein